jgi:hypothetical protein
MTVRVKSIDLDLPDDFPNAPYDAIQARVDAAPQNKDQTFHFGGAWNAVVYRFLSCANADERFTALVRAGITPGQPRRFEQEESLVDFFVDGLSEIESFFYGLYWICSLVDPASFPVVTGKKLRDVSTDKTMRSVRNGPYSASFQVAFNRLQTQQAGQWVNTPEYEEWKDVRNILAHRASYGRVLNAASGGGTQLDDLWRVRDIPINDRLTASRRVWLAETMKCLLESTEALVTAAL